MNTLTENQRLLRRAKEAFEYCKEMENSARIALADAVVSTRKAREKYEALFKAEEKAEIERRRRTWA